MRRLHLMIAFTLLAGCRPSEPIARLNQFVPALADSPMVASADQALAAIPPPPSDTLQLPIPASSLDRLDFLSLSGCTVQATIIKRNSTLGRTAKASQHLLLALEFLQLAPACSEQLQARGNHALALMLQSAWQEHQAQLPALIFNATLGGDEYRAFWLVDRAPADYPRTDPYNVAGALRSIDSSVSRWLDGDYRAHPRNLELLLSEIAGGDGGVRLQVLPEHDDPARWRSVASINALEHQLAAVLPPRYRQWRQQRNHSGKLVTLQQSPYPAERG